MALRRQSLEPKEQVLSVCVRLFLEQGYHQTTVSQILQAAGISASSFQNIFRAKDGVLSELVMFMFNSQFETARVLSDAAKLKLPVSPIFVYAIETSIQLAITEINENIRDMYIEAYSAPETLQFIHRHTAAELKSLFGDTFPTYTEDDFYNLEIGSAGIMRGYMIERCDVDFTLEKKLSCFLALALRAYRVPEEEIDRIIAYILRLDIRDIANTILDKLFSALAMRFHFTLTPNTEKGCTENNPNFA